MRGHGTTATATELRAKGCTCEFGCRSCGMSEAQMGNCPRFDACPAGRAPDPDCPLTKEEPNG